MRSLGRVALAFALANWVVCSVAIGPQHVHQADAQHAQSLTHRHFEAHEHEQAEIEGGDGHIVWLSGDVAVHCAIYHLTVAHVAVSTTINDAPSFASWMAASILDGSPPHGPPRLYTPLRAPPPLPV